jgi:predicted flap endonuclease-1-like 5' DNA nuclease
MIPTRYLKRVWFWLGMGTGTLALTGLIAWIWRTRPHGPNIQPVQIDFTFLRHPAEAQRSASPAAPQQAARAVVAAALIPEPEPEPTPMPAPGPEAAPRAESETTAQSAPDDLTVLVGIGPRIAAVLREVGVTTFAGLAQTDPAWLREVLQAHNLRLADPESWPEQARLAAEGKLQDIQKFSARRRSASTGS